MSLAPSPLKRSRPVDELDLFETPAMRAPTVTTFFARVAGLLTTILTLGYFRPTTVTVAVVDIGGKRRIIEDNSRDRNDDSTGRPMPGAWPETSTTPPSLPPPPLAPLPAIEPAPSPKPSPLRQKRSQAYQSSPTPSASKIRRTQAYNHFWEQRRRLLQPPSTSAAAALSKHKGLSRSSNAITARKAQNSRNRTRNAIVAERPMASLAEALFPGVAPSPQLSKIINTPIKTGSTRIPDEVKAPAPPAAYAILSPPDIDMTDAPGPSKKTVQWAADSVITEKPDRAILPKHFFPEEAINELPENCKGWRSPAHEEDITILESPHYFGNEQDKSPELVSKSHNQIPKTPRSLGPQPPQFETPVRQVLFDQAESQLDGIIGFWTKLAEHGLSPDETKVPKMAEERIATIKAKKEAARRRQQELVDQYIAKRKAEADALKAKLAAEKAAEEARQAEEYERRQRKKALEDAIANRVIWKLEPPWDERIAAAMATPSASAQLAPNEVTRHDMGTLLPQPGRDNPSGWLNDQIVNTTLMLMVDHALAKVGHDKKDKEAPAPFWAFNSAWLKTISKEEGIKAFSRWGKKRGINLVGKKILQAKTIFFPICNANHWTVAIVYPQQRVIEYLDSFGGTGPQILKLIRGWLKQELGNEDYIEYEWDEVVGHSARQGNVTDCGVFAVMNSWARIRGLEPARCVVQEDMGTARTQIAAILLSGGFDNGFAFKLPG